MTYSFPLAAHLSEESGQSDLKQSFLVEPPLDDSAVIVQLLLTHRHMHTHTRVIVHTYIIILILNN